MERIGENVASITKDPNGRKRLLFVAPDGKRKAIRLGKMSLRAAESIKSKIEDLISSKTSGCAWSNETARWVAEIPDALADKLAAVGLVEAKGRAALGVFLEDYIQSRHDAKPGTIDHLRRVQNDLIDCFDAEKPLRDFTPGNADGFRLYLIGRKLAENTVRRRCGRAKQFFTAAVRRGLVFSNPFADLKSAVLPNPSRFYFISREEADKVLDACPDAEWRLIFALSRYGGLRCPSEHLALRWGDVDWERNRLRVPSPKTEHHHGGESRVVPIFPELRPHLEAAWEQAQPGTESVINHYRDSNVNLRSRLLDIIWSAGLKEWPKLFQNLRSTRETELAETFPMHVVCKWIGNSQPVAAKHYLQVTNEHFNRAIEGEPKAAQNAAQYMHESDGKGQYKKQQTPVIPEEYEGLPLCTDVQAPRQGLEPWTKRLTAACSTN